MASSPSASAQFGKETASDGSFQRQESMFRRWVEPRPGADFPADAGRYHLYVSLACPWAHRTVITRMLKGLEDAIGMTVVDPIRDDRGWAFRDGPGHSQDPINSWSFLSEGYLATDPSFSGRVTTPTLWDTVSQQVVSNESGDIMRMLNAAFDEWAQHDHVDLYPADLRDEIDELNTWIYPLINNGVYRSGFATTQTAYEHAVRDVFDGLDRAESVLSTRRYLTGNRITEADWRLFVTLLRFDSVYVSHFKCSMRRVIDYPNLWGFVRDLYSQRGIADTVNMDHIKRHYYMTHDRINPTRIVPAGPDIDFAAPHDRDRLG